MRFAEGFQILIYLTCWIRSYCTPILKKVHLNITKNSHLDFFYFSLEENKTGLFISDKLLTMIGKPKSNFTLFT
jgi:hypothetical protein